MIVLRFTKTQDEKYRTSTDNVNDRDLKGLCGFDITDAVQDLMASDYSEEEAFIICARKEAEHDNWHAMNHDGFYSIFEGGFVEFDRDNVDRFRKRAVVAKFDWGLAFGQLEADPEYGWNSKSIRLIP